MLSPTSLTLSKVIYRVTIVNDDGTCYIGLQPTASIPLMVRYA